MELLQVSDDAERGYGDDSTRNYWLEGKIGRFFIDTITYCGIRIERGRTN